MKRIAAAVAVVVALGCGGGWQDGGGHPILRPTSETASR